MPIRSFMLMVVGCAVADASDAGAVRLDFFGETVGAVSTTLPPLVGQWVIATDGDNRVLKRSRSMVVISESNPRTLSTVDSAMWLRHQES